jgi:1-acyl-sn-glycerol-3-phosphate acyltransferase
MSREYFWYRFFYPLFCTVMVIRFRLKIVGRENIPSGGAMVCANHTSNFDPMLLIYALGKKNQLHSMAKQSLFALPVLGWFLRAIGQISVNRNLNDIAAVRSALGYLKNGEKVAVFPEGTRVKEDEAVAAKSGAVRLSERTGTPILPVYIPREKPFFGLTTVIIGKPYFVNPDKRKLTPDEYTLLSSELMEKIEVLKP